MIARIRNWLARRRYERTQAKLLASQMLTNHGQTLIAPRGVVRELNAGKVMPIRQGLVVATPDGLTLGAGKGHPHTFRPVVLSPAERELLPEKPATAAKTNGAARKLPEGQTLAAPLSASPEREREAISDAPGVIEHIKAQHGGLSYSLTEGKQIAIERKDGAGERAYLSAADALRLAQFIDMCRPALR